MRSNLVPSTRSLAALVATSTILVSCGLIYFYRELHELEGMQWLKDDVQTFEVSIEEPKRLDATLLIRHVEGYAFKDLPVHFLLKQGDEVILEQDIAVPIKDKNGDYVGEGSVDLWDINYPLFDDRTFSEGEYTFRFQHVMERDRIPLVMEVGLQLEEKE